MDRIGEENDDERKKKGWRYLELEALDDKAFGYLAKHST